MLHLPIVFSLLSLGLAIGSELNCDHIESFGLAQPAGACQTFGGYSFMISCDGIDAASYKYWFSNDLCMGDPDYSFEIIEDADTSINCCTGNTCPYVERRQYENDNCNDTNREFQHTLIYVTGHCQSNTIYECSSSTMTQYLYSNSNCSGSPIYTSTTTDRCEFDIETEIHCRNAKVTCPTSPGFTTTTAEPIATTSEPFPFPGSTLFPIEDEECDSIALIDETGYKSTEIYPMGVCAANMTANGTTYFMVECDGYDSANLVNYDNEYCSGDPLFIVSVEDYFNYQNRTRWVQRFEVQCCIGPCEIGTRISYFTSNCNETIDDDTYGYRNPNIIGACSSTESADGRYIESIKYTACYDGVLVEEIYNGVSDCSGSPSYTNHIFDGTCESRWERVGVECSTARDTCSFDKGPDCDGIEWRFNNSAPEFLPAGMCQSWGGISNMAVCNSRGDDMLYNEYDNDYCLGDPISNFSIRALFESFNGVDFTITCCSGNQCNYASYALYDADTACGKGEYRNEINYWTTDMCLSTQFNECENGVLTRKVYGDAYGNCSGDPDYEYTDYDGDCSGGQYKEIQCLSAIDTCQDSTPNPTETPEPTFPWPLFSTTMFPISDDLDCDHIELVAEQTTFGIYQALQWPVGYCNNGEMFECTGYDTANANTYDNEYCLGDPILSVPHDVFFNFSEAEKSGFVIDLTVSCCTGNGCDVVERRTHNDFWCGRNSTGLYHEDFAIIGGCQAETGITTTESIRYSSCSDGVLIEESYDGVTDCSGDPIITTIIDGECHSGTTTFIECGVAMETCPFNITGGCTTDKECGFAFMCVGGSCVRDCDAFDIDGYLECSSSFADVQYQIMQINSKIDIIDGNLTNVSRKINIIDHRSYLNKYEIYGINDEIEELQRKWNDTCEKIERFGVNAKVPYSAQSVANVPDGNNPFDFNKNMHNNPESIMNVFDTKDILIIGALLINMMIGIYNCLYKDNKDSKGRYKPVMYETSDDMDILSEQQVLQ